MAEENKIFQFEEKEKFFRKPAFLVVIITLAIGMAMVLIFYKKEIRGSMSVEEVGKSIQVVGQQSLWLDKKGRPDEATIVPSITFKIRNVGTTELQFVTFLGVFAFEDAPDILGEGAAPAIKTPLPPGGESEEIQIKSEWGCSASSKEAFVRNIQNWKRVKVKLYARCRNSGFALLGIFPIAQEMQGVKIQYAPAPETAATAKEKQN